MVVGETEGPPKCFAGVYHQLLALQRHIRGKAQSRLDRGGEFHVSPPWVERHVHDQIEVVGSLMSMEVELLTFLLGVYATLGGV